jgi:hypothetical protein
VLTSTLVTPIINSVGNAYIFNKGEKYEKSKTKHDEGDASQHH